MYDKSKTEKSAESWLKKHGYTFETVKQLKSKTVYSISKDGFSDNFELPAAVADLNLFMELISKSFDLAQKLSK